MNEERFKQYQLQAQKDRAIRSALEVILEDTDHSLLSKLAGYVEQYCKDKQQKLDNLDKKKSYNEMQDYLQFQGEEFLQSLQKQNHVAEVMDFNSELPEPTTLEQLRNSKGRESIEDKEKELICAHDINRVYCVNCNPYLSEQDVHTL